MEKGCNEIILEKSEVMNEVGVWNEYVLRALHDRLIKVVNQEEYSNKITRNQTIMDLAHQYIIEKKLSNKELNQINMVRLWKRMYLPIKLLGSRGR